MPVPTQQEVIDACVAAIDMVYAWYGVPNQTAQIAALQAQVTPLQNQVAALNTQVANDATTISNMKAAGQAVVNRDQSIVEGQAIVDAATAGGH